MLPRPRPTSGFPQRPDVGHAGAHVSGRTGWPRAAYCSMKGLPAGAKAP